MLDVGNIFELFPLPYFQVPFAKQKIEDMNFEQERMIETPSCVLISSTLQYLFIYSIIVLHQPKCPKVICQHLPQT